MQGQQKPAQDQQYILQGRQKRWQGRWGSNVKTSKSLQQPTLVQIDWD